MTALAACGVLALLFFKRACDRHGEETAAALDELAEIPDAMEIIQANPNAYHDLLIPDGCFWSDVRNTDEDRLGQAINDALLGISNANPEQLHGVFEAIDFNNKRAIPPEALADLLDHFEALGPLTDERCPADLLGQAYEWTIAKFAASSGKRGGEFYTPAQVGKLGARLLAPEPGQDVYDPTCGGRDRASAGHLPGLSRARVRVRGADAGGRVSGVGPVDWSRRDRRRRRADDLVRARVQATPFATGSRSCSDRATNVSTASAAVAAAWYRAARRASSRARIR